MNIKRAPIYPRHSDVHDFEWFGRSVELIGQILVSSIYCLFAIIKLLIEHFWAVAETTETHDN